MHVIAEMGTYFSLEMYEHWNENSRVLSNEYVNAYIFIQIIVLTRNPSEKVYFDFKKTFILESKYSGYHGELRCYIFQFAPQNLCCKKALEPQAHIVPLFWCH